MPFWPPTTVWVAQRFVGRTLSKNNDNVNAGRGVRFTRMMCCGIEVDLDEVPFWAKCIGRCIAHEKEVSLPMLQGLVMVSG